MWRKNLREDFSLSLKIIVKEDKFFYSLVMYRPRGHPLTKPHSKILQECALTLQLCKNSITL